MTEELHVAFETATLGGLLLMLGRCSPGSEVYFNCGSFRPKSIASYRGYYDHLAIGYTDEGDAPKVSAVMAMLRAAIGKTFEGYKGGHYVMREDAPVWVANWGVVTNTTIVGVKKGGDVVVYIMTGVTW